MLVILVHALLRFLNISQHIRPNYNVTSFIYDFKLFIYENKLFLNGKSQNVQDSIQKKNQHNSHWHANFTHSIKRCL